MSDIVDKFCILQRMNIFMFCMYKKFSSLSVEYVIETFFGRNCACFSRVIDERRDESDAECNIGSYNTTD